MSGADALSTTLDRVVAAVRQSRRYSGIDEAVIRRSAARALLEARGQVNDAIKRTKRQLHQVYGAYAGVAHRYDRLLSRLTQAHAEGRDEFLAELRRIMALHASTRERLLYLEDFYSALFARVGPVTSILDVGCGLNPLAAPWMRLSHDAVYTAVEIEASLAAFVGDCLDLMAVRARSLVSDAIASPPQDTVDLALVLKLAPCLEQQQRGAAGDLIGSLRARFVAVSFPVRSLGGRGKGMHANYARVFEQMAGREQWNAEEIAVRGELLYLITKVSSSSAGGDGGPIA